MTRLWAWLIAITLALYTGGLAVQLAGRVAFPWDVLTCFETPYLASMIKLHNGEPMYSPRADYNSEVYSPGFSLLAHTVLSPWGAETDIRFGRLVAVITAVAAAGAAAACMAELLRALGRPAGGAAWVVFALAANLLIHRSLTSDMPHPDNLHMAHAAACLFLSVRSLRSGSWRTAAAACALAGIGGMLKQTAILAPVGVGLALAAGPWSARRKIALAALGIAVAAAAAASLSADARHHVFAAFAGHQWLWSKPLDNLLDPSTLTAPFRVILLIALPWAVPMALRSPGGRRFLAAYAAIGFFEVGPALPAYLKIGGNNNNLAVIDLWLLLLVAPCLALPFFAPAGEASPTAASAAPERTNEVAVLSLSLAVALAVSLYPLKYVPRAPEHLFCHRLEKRIRDDVAAGRTVYVPTGAMFLLRAGRYETPRDLSVYLETEIMSGTDPAELAAAISARGPDRIYMMFPYAGARIKGALLEAYTEDEPLIRIDPWTVTDARGIQPYLQTCWVLSAKRPKPR